jgi:NAD(P)-dependent dehydrogenase (short-subunit alcohol dehydrogenase family)
MTGDSGRLLQGRSHMSKRFVGKLAVVTGGSTGMGLATARRFVQEGIDHIFITGRGQGALDARSCRDWKESDGATG